MIIIRSCTNERLRFFLLLLLKEWETVGGRRRKTLIIYLADECVDDRCCSSSSNCRDVDCADSESWLTKPLYHDCPQSRRKSNETGKGCSFSERMKDCFNFSSSSLFFLVFVGSKEIESRRNHFFFLSFRSECQVIFLRLTASHPWYIENSWWRSVYI